MSEFGVETVILDLPALAAGFGARLEQAGVVVGVERAAAFAHALTLVRPVSRGRLYFTARAALISDRAQMPAFDRVFAEVFGAGRQQRSPVEPLEPRSVQIVPAPADDRPPEDRATSTRSPEGLGVDVLTPVAGRERESESEQQLEMPVLASDEELLRERRFETLAPAELLELYRLMERLRIETPKRLTRRGRRDRHGSRIDMRRTLRASMRTGGDPLRLARRSRATVPRRVVLLCDISGSMEPYARVYLQFLTSAAGSGIRSGGPVEAFVFATRLTRLTRALSSRSPERAIQRAAAAAPDWSSGTRIGDALKRFNDRYGRHGLARGSVIVILSDGWERGSPELVAREMQRLSRLAHRIIWVNPRAAAREFAPRAAGMAAALPYCDALVSGESLAALETVVRAIGCPAAELPGVDWPALGVGRRAASVPPPAPQAGGEEDEPWQSATPVAGSSVAMPSGWGPSRGRTTPGWGRR